MRRMPTLLAFVKCVVTNIDVAMTVVVVVCPMRTGRIPALIITDRATDVEMEIGVPVFLQFR